MASVQEQVLAAVETVLAGVGAPTGLTVHREPAVPLEDDVAKAIVVYPANRDAAGGTHGATEHRLEFVTELRRKLTPAERTAGTVASTAMDELYVWTVQALFGALGTALNVIELVEVAQAWDQEIADRLHARSAVTWLVVFHTDETDPETRA